MNQGRADYPGFTFGEIFLNFLDLLTHFLFPDVLGVDRAILPDMNATAVVVDRQPCQLHLVLADVDEQFVPAHRLPGGDGLLGVGNPPGETGDRAVHAQGDRCILRQRHLARHLQLSIGEPGIQGGREIGVKPGQGQGAQLVAEGARALCQVERALDTGGGLAIDGQVCRQGGIPFEWPFDRARGRFQGGHLQLARVGVLRTPAQAAVGQLEGSQLRRPAGVAGAGFIGNRGRLRIISGRIGGEQAGEADLVALAPAADRQFPNR